MITAQLMALCSRVRVLTEARPRLAFWTVMAAVMLLVVWEAAFWPRNDYPYATWHNQDRGVDVERCQAGAARAGWSEMLGFWHGPYIDGIPTFRPLSAWLFIAEHRMFGRRDRLWCGVSVALHLVCMALLFWTAGVILGGSRSRRLAAGAATALLAGGPGCADQSVHRWVLGWWPSQPDLLSLACALVLLASTAQYIRGGGTRWMALAIGSFVLGILFKEMSYFGGAAACLLCLRNRKAWPLLAALACVGLAGAAYRLALYHGQPGFHADGALRIARTVAIRLAWAGTTLDNALQQVVALGVGVAGGFVWRRRGRTLGDSITVAVVLYGIAALSTIGLPTDRLFASTVTSLSAVLAAGLLVAGTARACRDWPVPELIVLAVGLTLVGWSFPPAFAWHMYWALAFRSLVAAASILAIADYVGVRMAKAKPRKRDDQAIEPIGSA